MLSCAYHFGEIDASANKLASIYLSKITPTVFTKAKLLIMIIHIIIINNKIFTIPLSPPLKRGTCGKAKPCSPTATVKHINPSSRRIASDGLGDTLARDKIKSIVTIVTIEAAEMVAINNRPRRRNGLIGLKGLSCRPQTQPFHAPLAVAANLL